MRPAVEMSDDEREEWLRVRLDDLSKDGRDRLFRELLDQATLDEAFRKWITPEDPVMREKFKDLFKHKGKRGK